MFPLTATRPSRSHADGATTLGNMITRRAVFAAVGAGTSAMRKMLYSSSVRKGQAFAASLIELEAASSGRLGVAVLSTTSGEVAGHRADERFAMCSTFKMLLAAAVLRRSDSGLENLDRAVDVPIGPLLSNSPLTQEHAGSQMTLRDLCRAAIVRSDNTAANLLLASLGGPPAISQFARAIGDYVTRLDRIELALNEAAPGDPRDTTSPAAMLGNLKKLLLGDVLSAASRDHLTRWMVENQTGNDRLRAGFPTHWRVADKTGSNAKNTTNDIAVAWPPNQQPILVSVYLTECEGPEEKRNAVLAKVARLAAVL